MREIQAQHFTTVSEPVSEPVTLPDVKLALQIESTGRDKRIESLIAGAREEVETDLLRQLVSATYQLLLDGFSHCIEIRKCPVSEIESIEYLDTNEAWQTVDEDVYGLDSASEPARVYLKQGQSWPVVLSQPNSVRITFTAGYGDAKDVPQTAKEMIYLKIRQQLDGWPTDDEYEKKKLKLAWTV